MTITLEKEIALEAEKLGPRIPLNHNVPIQIQRPVQLRLKGKPVEQIQLKTIPDLKFVRAKGGNTHLPLLLYCRVLVQNTGYALPPKKDIGVLVATDDTENPWNTGHLLQPLAQIHCIVFVCTRRHCPDNASLLNKWLYVHLVGREKLQTSYRRIQWLGNSVGFSAENQRDG
jgi:hypothetical protein